MKRRWIAAAVILLALGISSVVLVRQSETETPAAFPSTSGGIGLPPTAATGAVETGAPSPATNAAESAAGGVRVLPTARELVRELNDPAEPPENDVEIVNAALAEFRRIFGQNPPGGVNMEITAALTGDNPKKLAVVPPDSPALNAAGELVDRWNTPFHFHPVSGTVMEVLSAGPDRVLWTADDIGTLNPVDGPVAP